MYLVVNIGQWMSFKKTKTIDMDGFPKKKMVNEKFLI